MAAFDYIAADAAGRTVSGSVTAADEGAARKALAKRQLAPLQLSPGRSGAVAAPSKAGKAGRLSPKTLALTTRQLATLISVSPLEEALRNLMLQADRPNVRRVLEGVHAGVIEGRRLSDAMGQQGAAFPPLYRAMTAAGEQSGALQPILERLADGLERDEQVRGKVLTALVYPCVLAVVALGVIVAMMTYIVPKVVDQFDSMGQTLPLLTRLVIGLSDLMRDWGWMILLMLAAVVAAGLIARRREAVRL
jgi:general secretion pathway protein F